MKKQDKTSYDIVIVGAGPTGLAFAIAMSGQGLSIAVIDPAKEAVLADPPYDGRETALTHASHRFLTDLGILDKAGADAVSFIKHAHVINGNDPYALRFSHAEAGTDTLGYMISNHVTRRASYERVIECKDVDLLCDKAATQIEPQGKHSQVTLNDGQVLSAKLVIGADGRFSKTRRMMGIKTDVVDWGRTCLVGVMHCDGDHNDTAYECFHYDRTLAVLPLGAGKVSVVITLPSSQAASVTGMVDEDFVADIQKRFEGRVGAMSVDKKVQSYELACTYANRFVSNRFALLGDAAVGMHPVTAHGYNLGLSGAQTLSEQIKLMARTGGDIGSPIALGAYDRTHQLQCKPLYLGTNTLVKLYSDTRPAAKLARKALLHLGNILKPAKDVITRQLTAKAS